MFKDLTQATLRRRDGSRDFGRLARFWNDRWCGPWQLLELFPNLYEVAPVAGADERIENRWSWSLCWNRQLRPKELAEAEMLENLLLPLSLDSDTDDSRIWLRDKSLNYKVKKTYEHLVLRSHKVEHDEGKRTALRRLLGTAASSKFLVMAWRILSDGLPIRVAL